MPCNRLFRIQADGKDITALINDRLLLLRTTDKPGMESDDFELRIDARDGVVALPARGALIEVHRGVRRPAARPGWGVTPLMRSNCPARPIPW